jgi:hypothetical protein
LLSGSLHFIFVSMMPKSNPLRIILTALAHRVGATAGLMMLDPVATALPAAGEVWDLITIIGLLFFWYTFFKQLPVMGRLGATRRSTLLYRNHRLRSRCHSKRLSQTTSAANWASAQRLGIVGAIGTAVCNLSILV